MKVFIVCSKYNYNKIPEIKEKLERLGQKITLPNSYDDPLMEERLKSKSIEEHRIFKGRMMRLQTKKIRQNDAILVLNLEKNGIKNYIGGATFMEIIKAWELNKKIFFYNPIPNCSFTDELKGINPKIINKELSLIK